MDRRLIPSANWVILTLKTLIWITNPGMTLPLYWSVLRSCILTRLGGPDCWPSWRRAWLPMSITSWVGLGSINFSHFTQWCFYAIYCFMVTTQVVSVTDECSRIGWTRILWRTGLLSVRGRCFRSKLYHQFTGIGSQDIQCVQLAFTSGL